jgi:3',5'-cyclic-AMP phosphodiesterase
VSGQQTLKLVQLSDLHICAEPGARLRGVDPRATLESLLPRVLAEGPERVVVTGDLSYDGSTQAYAYLGQVLSQLGLPVHLLLGNHDHPRRALALAGYPGLSLAPVVECFPWRIVLWDSNPAQGYKEGEYDGQVGPEQWRLLAEACRGGEHVLLCLHHNPVEDLPMGIAMGLTDAAETVARLASCVPLRLVLCGHIHQAYQGSVGVPVLACPTTNFQSRTADGGESNDGPGFRVVCLEPGGGYRTRIVRLGEYPVDGAENLVYT